MYDGHGQIEEKKKFYKNNVSDEGFRSITRIF